MNDEEREWQYQSVTQTANSLHVSTGKLREWLKAGMIEYVRPGGKFGHIRVSIESAKRFIEIHTINRKEQQHE